LEETLCFGVFKGFFFAGEWGWYGADAFRYAGGAAGHGCDDVLERVDGPPEAAAGFFCGFWGLGICETEIDTEG
jgi:hypothetical protein